MTDDNDIDIPSGRLYRLKYSITNLWDHYGQQERIGLALAVNLLFTVFGILVYMWGEGLVGFAGAVWAILHVLAIIKWVVGL